MPSRKRRAKKRPVQKLAAPPLPPQPRGDWRGQLPKLQIPKESDLIERLGMKIIE